MKIEAGRTFYGEGFKADFIPDSKPKKTIPGGTAKHEAMHVIAGIMNGTSVESASIIPGPGYNGITKLAKADAVAAMAPHSMGASGTSYDVYIAGLMGNASSAESAARSIIMSNQDKVEAVAVALEEKRFVSSSDINMAINEVDNPAPISGTLFVESDEGKLRKIRAQLQDNMVALSEELIDLQKTA